MIPFKPPSTSVLIYFVLLSVVLYIALLVRSYRRLSHIPGPKLWGWSVFPLFRLHAQGGIYDKFGELSRQYGPLVRIAPNTLLASDPDVLRRMSAPRSPYSRSDWFVAMRLSPGQDNVLSTRDEKRHEELRRRMTAGYSGKENLLLEHDIDECVLELVDLVDKKYISTADRFIPMDLAQKIQFFTSDIMSKLSFDAKFHDLRDDNDNYGYINEIQTLFPNIFCTCTIPSVIDFLTDIGLLQAFAPSGNSKLGLGKVLAITHEQVSKRFDVEGKVKDDKSDMLGSFIRHGLSQSEAEQESVMQLYVSTGRSPEHSNSKAEPLVQTRRQQG